MRTLDRLTLAGLLTCLIGIGCSAPTTPIDWARLEAAGRVVETPAGLDCLLRKGSFEWTDGTVPLELIPIESVFARGNRLSTSLSGSRGNATRFLLDTGSVGSLIGARSALAAEAMISRIKGDAIGPVGAKGFMGHLPFVRMGRMEARDLAVLITTQTDIPESERNILGIVHLWHTQIEHRGGRWTLRNGADRLTPMETGWKRVVFEKGTPVVSVRNPNGALVKALVDMGAFSTVALTGAPKGTYTILADDGSIAHQVRVRKSLNHTGTMGGHKIDLLIGMDLLAGRTWRMTFNESTWALEPRR